MDDLALTLIRGGLENQTADISAAIGKYLDSDDASRVSSAIEVFKQRELLVESVMALRSAMVVSLYTQGRSTAVIADALSISKATITKMLEENSIPLRRGAKPKSISIK
jgi:hypothetical protein